MGKSLRINPETAPNTDRYAAGSAEFFVMWDGVIDTINHDDDSSLTLEQGEYRGALATSKLSVTQRADQEDRWRWVYDGEITLRQQVDRSAFLAQLDVDAGADQEVSCEGLYFNNIRLLASKASGALSVVSFFGDHVTYHNEGISEATIYKGLSIHLAAPTLDEVEQRGQSDVDQLVSQIRGYLLTLNALATVAEGQPRHQRLIVTSQGPFYPTKKKDRYTSRPPAEAMLAPDPADNKDPSVVRMDAYRHRGKV